MHLIQSRRLLLTIYVRSIFGFMCLYICLAASIRTQASDMLHWQKAWVRSVPPGTQVTAAYGVLMNHSDETVTISQLTANIGSETQMHDVIVDEDQRRMVQIQTADIAPGASLVFEPGSRHMMLVGVTEPPPAGDQVEICALSAAGAKACTQATISRQAPEQHDTHSAQQGDSSQNRDMHSSYHH